jgi:protein-tyrosine phosphatase
MYSDLYWIETDAPVRLAIMARPRAGEWLEDEVAHWRREGVGVVLSLLESDEVAELGLQDEASICEQAGIRFLNFPIRDRGVPTDPEAARRIVSEALGTGLPLAIHCRTGIGRSSLMAALSLAHIGVDPETALTAIASARRLPVPDTDEQREWVLAHGG